MSISVAIVGASGHAGIAFDGFAELEDASLVAVAPGCAGEDLAAMMRDAVVVLHAPAYYEDYLKMLDEQKPDIVVVNPYFYLHSEVSVACLERGIAVFCEKPLALEMDSLRKVYEAHKRSGARIGMMLGTRYVPTFYTARQLVQNGAIGEPAAGYSQKSYKFGSRPWQYRERKTFGGIIPWVGIHAVDWFWWVSGVDYRAVSAFHANRNAPDYPGLEDIACCLFELENGGSVVMSFDFLRPKGAPSHGDDRLRLVGTKGVLEITEQAGLMLTDASGQRQVEPEKPPRGPFADFALSVVDGSECMVTTKDSIEITRVCLMAREAADTGHKIMLGVNDIAR